MKQYLMLCDEVGFAQLKAIFKPETVQFLEIQGMNMGATNQFNLLVTPVVQPLAQAVIPQDLPPAPPIQPEPMDN